MTADRQAAAAAGVRRPRVLLTLTDVPSPADRGKRMRQAALLRGLTAVADVDVALVLPEEVAGGVQVLLALGAVRGSVFALPLRRPSAALLRVATDRVPWQMAVRRYDRVASALGTWARPHYDLIVFGSLDHDVGLRRAVSGDRTVVDLDDVETEKQRAFLSLPPAAGWVGRFERLQRRVELPLWRRLQVQACGQNVAVLVCSELDRMRLGGKAARVVPNTYDDPGEIERPPALEGEPVVLMVGTWLYEPNADSARYAARNVLPRLLERVPSARLRFVGAGASRLDDLKGLPGVDVVGYVDDLSHELRRATATLVPWRYGGGTRLKVLEALAWGLPVVGTSLGCEGLGLMPGREAVLADDAASLAQGLAVVLTDAEQRHALSRAGRDHYLQHFRPEVADAALARLVDGLGAVHGAS